MDSSHSGTGGMISESQLNELLANLLEVLPELLAVLVVDLDGLVIARQSREKVNENAIGAIMGAIDLTINRIKTSTEISLGSGSFDTDEFQIIFIRLNGKAPVLFAMVSDRYSNIHDFIPHAYLAAEKISKIMYNHYTSLRIPKFVPNGQLEFFHQPESPFEKKMVVKIVVLGDDAVGKSSLMELYVNGKFEPDYKPTIGISLLIRDLQISKKVKLTYQIFDMSGSRSFAKVRKLYYLLFFSPEHVEKRTSSAVFIVFDCTKIESLNNAKSWIEESQKFISDPNISYFLLGNKIDLIEDREEIQTKGKIIAEQNNCTFIATSAITGEGLDEIFTRLANDNAL